MMIWGRPCFNSLLGISIIKAEEKKVYILKAIYMSNNNTTWMMAKLEHAMRTATLQRHVTINQSRV